MHYLSYRGTIPYAGHAPNLKVSFSAAPSSGPEKVPPSHLHPPTTTKGRYVSAFLVPPPFAVSTGIPPTLSSTIFSILMRTKGTIRNASKVVSRTGLSSTSLTPSHSATPARSLYAPEPISFTTSQKHADALHATGLKGTLWVRMPR